MIHYNIIVYKIFPLGSILCSSQRLIEVGINCSLPLYWPSRQRSATSPSFFEQPLLSFKIISLSGLSYSLRTICSKALAFVSDIWKRVRFGFSVFRLQRYFPNASFTKYGASTSNTTFQGSLFSPLRLSQCYIRGLRRSRLILVVIKPSFLLLRPLSFFTPCGILNMHSHFHFVTFRLCINIDILHRKVQCNIFLKLRISKVLDVSNFYNNIGQHFIIICRFYPSNWR